MFSRGAGVAAAAVHQLGGNLASAAGMAGNDPAGTTWAVAYDEAVDSWLGAAADLIAGLSQMGGMVAASGQNHAGSESSSTVRAMARRPRSAQRPLRQLGL